MAYPSIREQDEFLSKLGVDPMQHNVEVVTIHDYKNKAMTVLFQFEKDGETRIATYWP